MKIVSFNKEYPDPYFEYEDGEGVVNSICYNLPIDDLSDDIHVSDYSVELLINPMLSNQSDIFRLYVKQEDQSKCDRQTVGAVFPVSALDSNDSIDRWLCEFLYVGFWQLLERLNNVKDGDFSDNFESNVCVCVISKNLTKSDKPLHLCIHSLRKYGYCYFVENNSIKQVSGYKRERIIPANKKSFNIEFKEPILYSHPMVDRILRDIGGASNVIHRFVLLYQIIELLLEDSVVEDVQKQYRIFISRGTSVNNYLEDIVRLHKEKERIKNIFKYCNIKDSECDGFRKSYKNLLRKAGYNSIKEDLPNSFYDFRNQLTHSYRRLYANKLELCETIQYFEQIVLLIVERYPRYLP